MNPPTNMLQRKCDNYRALLAEVTAKLHEIDLAMAGLESFPCEKIIFEALEKYQSRTQKRVAELEYQVQTTEALIQERTRNEVFETDDSTPGHAAVGHYRMA